MKKLSYSLKEGLILLFFFIISQVLYKYFPKNIYLLKWTADRYYILFVLLLGLNYFEKFKFSQSLVFGHVIGLILGGIIGQVVYFSNIRKITPDMSAEEVYRLSNNPAVWIYIFIMLILFVCGLYMEKKSEKSKDKS